MADTTGFSPVTNFRTTLSTSITSTQTNIPLTSVTTFDGHVLVETDLGAEFYIVISPGGADMEIVKCTAISNSPPTATASARGLAFYGISEATVPANQVPHNAGSVVLLTNTHYVYKRFVDKEANETVGGVKTFSAAPQVPTDISSNIHSAASIEYANSLAIAGAPNASTTVKGIIQIATSTQAAAGTATGSTGAILVPSNSLYNATSSATTLIPVTNASGKIDASFGGAAGSVATLNGSSKTVQDPASATATPTANSIPKSDANGTLNSWISENAQNIQSYIAGETITVTVPQAVYLKSSDGKIYNLNATTAGEAAFGFIGFAYNSAIAGGAVSVQTQGLVLGFSGLTPGSYYFGTNTPGAISATAGTISYQLGRADSTGTELLIQPGRKAASGTTFFNSTATTVITCGFLPSRIFIYGTTGQTSTIGYSFGGWDATAGNNSTYGSFTQSSTITAASNTVAWTLISGSSIQNVGTVTTITSTGFTLSNTKTGAAAAANLFWQAEA